jgi:hypothetical protein
MQSDIAGRDVRSESLRHPRSIARRMSAVAGALFVAAIVVGIPEAQRRLTLVLQLDGRSPATILTALAAFTILLVLYGVPAICLLHGKNRFRTAALAGPLLTLGSLVITAAARSGAGDRPPAGLEIAELISFTVAAVVLLSGRPSRGRLRAGIGLAGFWLVLSLVRTVAVR